ncbi:MAG: hypothetical protein CMJ29_06425 [Phycisphaerae bacterium]|nr:hypothetical protein [Phycisphaerae bacterium]|tara:strand:- start:880 stop:2505 length:1626 start_codon:yes stop_codon:yes gene_type:complete
MVFLRLLVLISAALVCVPAWAEQQAAPDAVDAMPAGEGEDIAAKPPRQIDPARRHDAIVLGPHEIILRNNHFPVRQGHGGWHIYDRAGRAMTRFDFRSNANVTTVTGEAMPLPEPPRGLLKTIFSPRPPGDDKQQGTSLGSGWTGKGLRLITDEHKLAQVSEPLFDFNPFDPLNETILRLRRDLLDPLSISFEPAMAWTYQHATEVRPGYQHARSVLWFGVNGAFILWDDKDDSGRVVYNIQSQQGAFTPTKPYLGTAVGSPLILNNILVSSDFNLYMLYWAQQLFDKKVTVVVGKFENQVFFDANAIAYNPLTQFMYEGFNESITNPFPGYGFGAMVEWSVTDDWTLRAATSNSETTGKSTGFEYLSSDHLFSIVESTFDVELHYGDRVNEGHYRFMFWYNSIGDTGTGKNPWDASGWGATFNMDQQIWDGLGVFCRVGWGENDVTSSNFAVSAGFSIENFLGRQGDAIGFAGSWAKITQLGRYQANLPLIAGDETVFELYWRTNVTDSVQVSPVLQYVHDSGAGIDGSWVWGVRSVWSF